MKLRINETKGNLYNFAFSTSRDVYENMKEYNKADREIFMVLYLTAKNHVVDCELHSIGTLDSCGVYPREIIKGAIMANASSIVCVHNHPTGDPIPSRSDDQITQHITTACELMQIKMLDHVILGHGVYYSYADEGKLDDYEQEAKSLPFIQK